MASIMKKAIQTFSVLLLLSSCSRQASRHEQELNSIPPIIKEKVGRELFSSILDTIRIEPVTVEILLKNKWIFTPFKDCESFLKFQKNDKGISYGCELEEEYEMTFIIKDNKILLSEFDIPNGDNEGCKKIKTRDDTYIYNGHSLIMVDSRMYNVSGDEWIPEIKVAIKYERKQ